MKIHYLNNSGFSLVELLVVVSIVAVLSISSIVGFGYLGDILKVREVTGFISDTIKQEELKILRGDFEKVTVHFLADYLVVEEEPEGTVLGLSLRDECDGGYEIDYADAGNLTQKNEKGELVQIKNVSADSSECIEFKGSEELEWNFQLQSGSDFSPIVRFVHFNLQREALGNPISITTGAGSKIEMTAPYGKKLIYDNGTPPKLTESLDITVEDESGNSSDTLTLQ